MLSSELSTHAHDHYTEAGEHIISHDAKFSDIGNWLKNGWYDMAHAPGVSLFYGLVMALSVALLFLVFLQQPIFMLTVAVAFIILSPFLATGLYYTANRLENGQKPSLGASMLAWRRNVSDFALFAVSLIVLGAIWVNSVPFLTAIVLETTSLLIVESASGLSGVMFSESGLAFLALFAGISLLIAAFVFAISVVTIPLLLRDKNIGAIQAMILSFQIVMENKKVMTAWALTIGVMLLIGIATLGLGMLIVMPLLGYASWHAFNDLVEIEKPA
jgi:uncharacterized membrane protein